MQVDPSGRKRGLFALTAVLILITATLLAVAYPEERGMVWLALYTIPSHMFVSPFPHEPVLLFYAKTFPALDCAVASIIGCLIAGMWDYWLFVPLVHHPRVRPRYVNTGLYRRSVALFRRSPFWALVTLGLTPLPFYPIKFLALADGYPMHRYLLSLIVGRTPRYYGLAYLGYWLKLPNWLLAAAAIIILVVTIYKNRGEWRPSGPSESA